MKYGDDKGRNLAGLQGMAYTMIGFKLRETLRYYRHLRNYAIASSPPFLLV